MAKIDGSNIVFMLDETRQEELSETIPLGMQNLPIHLQYRDRISLQQKQLGELKTPAEIVQSVDLNEIKSILGISRVGVAPVQTEYLFENHQLPPKEEKVIVFVVPMSYEKMITAPSLESATEILRSYTETGEKVIQLTKYLRSQGHTATGHHPLGDKDEYHHLLLPPHAVKAGLGERGRTGLFIDYIHGPTVRIGAVSTSAPLDCTTSEPRGITEFCHRCRYCVRYCPPQALPDGTYLEQIQSGQALDFKIDAHRCFQYFKNHNGCGRCIVHCILAEPDNATIAKRLNRITTWYDKWIVSGKLDEMYDNELSS